MTTVHTERELLTALHVRYTKVRRGTIADRWVRAEHVRLSLGDRVGRVVDYIALDTYPRGEGSLAVHGHEVKVSRSDWLKELKDPGKAEAFRRFCHHWWLVVSDPDIVRAGELPAGWGLMVLSRGVARVKVQAPRQEPLPLPLELSISIAAAAARTASRYPLYLDAPDGARQVGPHPQYLCSACGEPSPCRHHQPRAHAQTADYDHQADTRQAS